jgi:hypothetical protein
MKKRYIFKERLTEERYKKLLYCLIEEIPYFSLVVRETLELDIKGREVLNLLRPFLISEENVSEWPGTKLYNGTAKLRIFRFNNETVSIILDFSSNIFDWKQPFLPEDLCLLRDDKSALFISISHEKDFYFELTDIEYRILGRLLYPLELISEM